MIYVDNPSVDIGILIRVITGYTCNKRGIATLVFTYPSLVSSFFFGGTRTIIKCAQGGAEGSVRLLLTKNPV